ncbi:MAG: bifunctional ornithine acetyltransferase/N-acetylglutamate synthase [Clostridia bacterium]|nr:bifunctional ornithine acetyltransferase/N-acetylglutamate synthase [Clostridia bacterium]
MEFISGGVCAAQGFYAGGIHCGIRPNKTKNDLALIYSEFPCVSAAMFTTNIVKAAPVRLDSELAKSGRARAVIANSGIANACCENDTVNAERMNALASAALGFDRSEVFVSSTGVIGQELNVKAVESGMPALIGSCKHSPEGSDAAARAIMTTDTVKKEFAVAFELGGKKVVIGGISKGSGMIHPNMGTMLCYLTTDCAIDRSLLDKALRAVCGKTFNSISVDGDMSTNDSLIIFANGRAGNPIIDAENDDYLAFESALFELCRAIARAMAADGEGAKHLMTCRVSGAPSETQAKLLAKSVICSTLTKSAIFGCDANWGRVLCAMGYSGVDFDPEKCDIAFSSQAGRIDVCRNGRGLAFDEELAKKILSENEVVIEADIKSGESSFECWGCDLTYDYVRINGDYRT